MEQLIKCKNIFTNVNVFGKTDFVNLWNTKNNNKTAMFQQWLQFCLRVKYILLNMKTCHSHKLLHDKNFEVDLFWWNHFFSNWYFSPFTFLKDFLYAFIKFWKTIITKLIFKKKLAIQYSNKLAPQVLLKKDSEPNPDLIVAHFKHLKITRSTNMKNQSTNSKNSK